MCIYIYVYVYVYIYIYISIYNYLEPGGRLSEWVEHILLDDGLEAGDRDGHAARP